MTLTVDEYKSASKSRRLFYRLYRHPLIMFGIGAPYVFLIQNRFFAKKVEKREKWNVVWTNVVLLALITGVSLVTGFKSFVIIELPAFYIASVWGTWLFYIQHQYEQVQWFRDKDWDYETVALKGSSYYKLPRLLQWFSGNIGFHHVHHLSSRIPNYKLERCLRENPLFTEVGPITLLSSLKSLRLRLWDEKSHKLISFKEALSPNP
jgi:omega-6 fatty acid desaturase (delta-12 desaturase)